MDNIKDIKYVLYINLESRTDRKKHVEKQLISIGLKGNRFNAVKMLNGAIGCSMSHLKCLQIAKEKKWDHLLIIEDDIEFINPQLLITQFNKFLEKQKKWDVLLLAGNNLPPYEKIDDYCIRVKKCQTTTGYLIKSHYYDTLINNIKEGIKLLMREPDKHVLYAIDKYWLQLQQKDNWYLITPLTVNQKQNYSDIEGRITNYSHLMLDLNKKSFFLKQLEKIKTEIYKLSLHANSLNNFEEIKKLYQMKEEVEEGLSFSEN